MAIPNIDFTFDKEVRTIEVLKTYRDLTGMDNYFLRMFDWDTDELIKTIAVATPAQPASGDLVIEVVPSALTDVDGGKLYKHIIIASVDVPIARGRVWINNYP